MSSSILLSPQSSKLPTSTPLSLALLLLSRISATSHGSTTSYSGYQYSQQNKHESNDTPSEALHTEAEMWKKVEIVNGKNELSYHDYPKLILSKNDFKMLSNKNTSIEKAFDSSVSSKIKSWWRRIFGLRSKTSFAELVQFRDFFEILQIMTGDVGLQGRNGLVPNGFHDSNANVESSMQSSQHSKENIKHLFYIYNRLLPLIYFHYIYYPSKNYYSYIVPTIQRSISNLWGQISVPHRTRKNVRDIFMPHWDNSLQVKTQILGFSKECYVSRVDMFYILNHVNNWITDSRVLRDSQLRSLLFGCLAVVYYIEMPESELRDMLLQYPKLVSFVKQCTEQYLPQRITAVPVTQDVPEATEEVTVQQCIQLDWSTRQVEQYAQMNKWFIGFSISALIASWLGMNYVFN